MPRWTTHFGQHSADCYGCKLQTLTLDAGAVKTHVKRGDPWEGNPVRERIKELQAAGRRVESFEMSASGAPTKE